MPNPSMGYASLFGAGDDAADILEQYEYITNTLGKQTQHAESEGLRGTLQHISENVREGLIDISGDIGWNPSTAALRKWLPRILGAAEAGSNPYTYALADVKPSFAVAVDKVGGAMVYDGLKMAKAVFKSSKGNKLNLTMSLLGKTEASQAFPGGLTLSTGQPFMHQDSVLTIASVSRPFDNMVLTIDNSLQTDRYYNSQTRTAMPEQDLIITLGCVVPFTSTEYAALYDKGVTAFTGATMVFTNGSSVLTFTLGALQAPLAKPAFSGRSEIQLPLNFDVRKVGSTSALAVTLVP